MMRNRRFREFTGHISHAMRIINGYMRIKAGTLNIIPSIIARIAGTIQGDERVTSHIRMLYLTRPEFTA